MTGASITLQIGYRTQSAYCRQWNAGLLIWELAVPITSLSIGTEAWNDLDAQKKELFSQKYVVSVPQWFLFRFVYFCEVCLWIKGRLEVMKGCLTKSTVMVGAREAPYIFGTVGQWLSSVRWGWRSRTVRDKVADARDLLWCLDLWDRALASEH